VARKPLLDHELIKFLSLRVHISRALSPFSIQKLADTWEISKATLYRYELPSYREATREYARRAYEAQREVELLERGTCYLCHGELNDHKRCVDCTILLHEEDPICTSCIDTRRRKILRALDPDVVDVTDLFNPH